ncbi:hypothetical protein PF007_g25831 [Phytophthora fragariae]|uniref:Probable pectate lyase F n=1 Tax=Phytophthora fragariae TaxID=53985 RepID=A0A6A3HB51_9STRA|nr:hypothetical protein PF011_g27962 [Phytophthora fragariae]KAE9073363.1 hypothetical protein PF007_g25831 [Phytophthora fragariae]
MEGVHCDKHDCTIENVWWDDVCEDALSVKGGTASSVTTVTGGGARSADDKVIQHNGFGTVKIDGFYGEDISKLYRSCGTCGDKQRKVSVSNVYVVNPGNAVVTVNKNWNDEATLSNVWVKSSGDKVKICRWSQGNANGEPSILGDGPSPPLCQYSESDVHINGDVSQATGNSTSSSSTSNETPSSSTGSSYGRTSQQRQCRADASQPESSETQQQQAEEATQQTQQSSASASSKKSDENDDAKNEEQTVPPSGSTSSAESATPSGSSTSTDSATKSSSTGSATDTSSNDSTTQSSTAGSSTQSSSAGSATNTSSKDSTTQSSAAGSATQSSTTGSTTTGSDTQSSTAGSTTQSSAAGSATQTSTNSSTNSSTSTGSVPDGTWPTSTGSVKFTAPHVIKAGEVFDGKMQTFDRSDITCTGGEGQKDTAVFLVEAGGTLKNAIIGKNQKEGVHCDDHDCTIENVWWDDVCEDALSVKGGTASSVTTVTNCGARSASDKVVQHNGYGTVSIDGFYAEEFGKLYRSCGDIPRTVTVKNVYAVNPLVSVVTVNKNYGDKATLSNIRIKTSNGNSDVKVCQWSQGGSTPSNLGDGPSGTLCQYSESDVQINQ